MQFPLMHRRYVDSLIRQNHSSVYLLGIGSGSSATYEIVS